MVRVVWLVTPGEWLARKPATGGDDSRFIRVQADRLVVADVVDIPNEPRVPLPAAAEPLARLLELIAARRNEVVRPHLANLGIELLPLLQLMNQDLALNLPMADIERRLHDRASENK